MRLSRCQRGIGLVFAVVLLGIAPALMVAGERPEANAATPTPAKARTAIDGKPTAPPQQVQIVLTVEASDPTDTFAATQVAEKLLRQLRDGLEARNSRQLLAAFDDQRMEGYLAFKDQVESFFAQYASFRVYLRVQSASLEQDHAARRWRWPLWRRRHETAAPRCAAKQSCPLNS